MIEHNDIDGDEISQWIEDYGSVTSYSFMIYGPMTIKDNAIINKGLTLMLMHNSHKDMRYVQLTDEIDREKAEAFGTYRGWNIQWVFPGNINLEFIEMTIKEGMEHLKLNYEFYGRFGENGV